MHLNYRNMSVSGDTPKEQYTNKLDTTKIPDTGVPVMTTKQATPTKQNSLQTYLPDWKGVSGDAHHTDEGPRHANQVEEGGVEDSQVFFRSRQVDHLFCDVDDVSSRCIGHVRQKWRRVRHRVIHLQQWQWSFKL